jgi:hypothetical protein
MEAIGDPGAGAWRAAFSRFRAMVLATTEPLAACADLNNAAVRGRLTNVHDLLRAAIGEVEHAISRAKQGRPLGDTGHDL